MRLVLPTGEDGVDREYVLDGVVPLDQLTLNESIELGRRTGKGILTINRGLAFLAMIIDVPSDQALPGISENLELMESYRALVWIARYRAGDRQPDGSSLTAEQSVDFPFARISVLLDPGDEVEDEPVNPVVPSTDGSQAIDGGSKSTRTPGRSAKTSAKKS